MAAALGALGGIGLRDLVSTGLDYVRRFGRIGFNVGMRIFRVMANPEVGVPFSIAVVKLTDLLSMDITTTVGAIDNIANSLEAFDPFSVFPPNPPNIERIINDAISSIPLNICGTPPNPLVDPVGALNWAGCNIANAFLLVLRGLYIIGRIISDGLLYIGTYIFDGILWVLKTIAVFILRYAVKPLVMAIMSVLSWLRDMVRWACCEYLKMSHILVMFKGGFTVLRSQGFSIRGFLAGSILMPLITAAAIALLVPECYAGAPPSPKPGPPAVVQPMTSALLLGRTYNLAYMDAKAVPIRKDIVAVDYIRVAEGSGLF